jgi:hypothetical protein
MFDSTASVVSLADHRQRIQRVYRTGELSPEVATVRLFRLDIDEIARARRLRTLTGPAPDCCPRGTGGSAA